MIGNNWIAFLITFFLAFVWLRINDFAAARGYVEGRTSRKIIHIGTGPLFILCWPLFTDTYSSRMIAALIPLAFTVQFALIGLGYLSDDAAVKAMTRTGDRREILHGPLYYGIIFVGITIIYWLDSPAGIVALMLLCGGDGLADIMGRRFGRQKLPWNKHKSWAGSLGMFLGGWGLTLGIMFVFISLSIFPGPLSSYFVPISVIAIAGTLVESLPIRDFDNITVTAAALLLGIFFF